MIRPPTQDFNIKVGPYMIEVIWSNEKTFNDNAYGMFSNVEQKIYLRPDMSEQITVSTFIHEVMHAITRSYDIDVNDRHIKEEEIVSRMSNAWYGFMIDNKWLYKSQTNNYS